MENILSVNNLKLSFYGKEEKVRAVNGVSFEVGAGETFALVGESGCGKTALCRAIMMLHAKHALIEEGSIVLCGKEITSMREKELRHIRGKDVSMIFQDPMSSLDPTLPIGKQIMRSMRMEKNDAKKQALELMEKVGISEAEERFYQYPHQFSGGMRQRIAIAIALAANPKLIIADEPTTSLDAENQDKIVDLLKNLIAFGNGKDKSYAVIFVTHDLALAQKLADRVAVMKDGQIVETGITEQVLKNPEHSYTKELVRSIHYEDKCIDTAASGEPILQIRGLSKSFKLGKKKRLKVLDDFNLTVNKGEIIGIVGNSGCGKTTLARCIMNLQKYDRGEISFAENCKKQMIFQDSSSAFNPRMKIFDIIAEPLVIKKCCKDKKELAERVFDVMKQVKLEAEIAQRFPYDISGGQRQRAAIARALITEPDLIIADEPISSLDVSTQVQIINLLKHLQKEKNMTMLIIAHDLPLISRISNRIVKITKQ